MIVTQAMLDDVASFAGRIKIMLDTAISEGRNDRITQLYQNRPRRCVLLVGMAMRSHGGRNISNASTNATLRNRLLAVWNAVRDSDGVRNG